MKLRHWESQQVRAKPEFETRRHGGKAQALKGVPSVWLPGCLPHSHGLLLTTQHWTIHLQGCKTSSMYWLQWQRLVLANLFPETIHGKWSVISKCFVSCTMLYKCEIGWQLWPMFCLIKYKKKIMPSSAGYFCLNQLGLCFLHYWPHFTLFSHFLITLI